MKINSNYEIYVEQRIGDVAIGWRYFSKEPVTLMEIDQVGINRGTCCINLEDAPPEVLKAIEILKLRGEK